MIFSTPLLVLLKLKAEETDSAKELDLVWIVITSTSKIAKTISNILKNSRFIFYGDWSSLWNTKIQK